MMNGLRSAIGFLTILPLAPSGAPGSLVSARGWFPLVGLLLGLILASLEILRMLMLQAGSSGWYGYAPLPVTYPVFLNYTILLWSVLLVVILVVLTRALHLDGFMDSCDALLGGFDRERRLAILRDPNVGAFAVIGVVCLLLIKVLTIAGLPPAIPVLPPGILELPPEGWSVRIPMLLLFPCLSRWAMLLTMELYPYVRSNGLGTAFFGDGERRVRWQLILGLAFTLIVSVAAGRYGRPRTSRGGMRCGMGYRSMGDPAAWRRYRRHLRRSQRVDRGSGPSYGADADGGRALHVILAVD